MAFLVLVSFSVYGGMVRLSGSVAHYLTRRYVLGGKMEYFQYYGIDWVAMVLTFLAIWQIGNKNKIGFILMMCGNTSWVAVGYLTGSVAMIIANIIFFSMNLRAIIKWSTPEKEPKVSVAEQSSTS